jgi:predicted nucleotidyltransferase
MKNTQFKATDKLIYKVIVGSQAYGTNTPESDIDYKGVYIQDPLDILAFGYKPQIEVTKDECYFEIRRFLELLQTANPTVLELLFTPEDCIIIKDPIMDLIFQHKEKFITKKCLKSFSGYAVDQIKKARGLDKKMNWKGMTRKKPIDFCYVVVVEGKTINLKKWLNDNSLVQENCGLAKIDHFRDCYSLYYSNDVQYKGICKTNGNTIRLSSIVKGDKMIAVMYYNKDGYTVHCKKYKEYSIWKRERNTQRYVDIEGHNQQIDGKNLLHCRRLIDTAIDIGKTGNIQVRRPNAEYLISIRKGKVDLETIISDAERDIKELDILFKNSNLPTYVDSNFVNDLLKEIRTKFL